MSDIGFMRVSKYRVASLAGFCTIERLNVICTVGMSKNAHEIRDPIHIFIRCDSAERDVLDSRPIQRLRHIHQLALSYLVYPGASHKRFEHSLGVMELADRVFDVVTRQDNVVDTIRDQLPEITNPDKVRYWRRVVRMAALCHDVGHLPFSHAAEKELLPDGWSHERLTREIIASEEMRKIWEGLTPAVRIDDIAKIAVGPKEAKGMKFSTWETILSEIVVGDAFGVDRMDYLLRDSHHSGVAYGRFDHFRLIDTMRLLQNPVSEEPALGVEVGGIQSAEALLWARYLMYSQVYFHAVRRVYDIHLQDFLAQWLPGGKFSTGIKDHLEMTDNEVMSALLNAARDPKSSGHDPARRIVNREHFRVFYERNPDDLKRNPEAAKIIFEAAKAKFGKENVRRDQYTQRSGIFDFPVQLKGGPAVSSLSVSEPLRAIPLVAVDRIYIIRKRKAKQRSGSEPIWKGFWSEGRRKYERTSKGISIARTARPTKLNGQLVWRNAPPEGHVLPASVARSSDGFRLHPLQARSFLFRAS